MKRAGNLWNTLTRWQHLTESARLAARGKRSRPDVARFLYDLEPNLCRLQRELTDGTYQPGPYRTFWIHDGKSRQISAAPFRDRVVHHALTGVLEPVFEPRFSDRSFASRKGFGQHRALTLAREACRHYRYVLKCDIRKYFPSMDHQILKETLSRVVKCRPTLDLAARIIGASNPQEPAELYFPGDTLFTPSLRRPALYLRYVDDFVLFADDKQLLRAMRERIRSFLDTLRLALHERKSRVYLCSGGLTFLG